MGSQYELQGGLLGGRPRRRHPPRALLGAPHLEQGNGFPAIAEDALEFISRAEEICQAALLV